MALESIEEREMNYKKPRVSARKVAFALLFACGLFIGDVNAQWLTQDNSAIFKSLEEYAKTAARWEQTLQNYQQQVAHYQQQLIELQNLNFQMRQLQNTFPKREDDWGLKESCPGATGISGLINGLIPKVLPAVGDNVSETQQEICGMIVMAQNAKYNKTIDMLDDLVTAQNDYMAKIDAQRDDGGTSQGALAANDNETQRFLARTSVNLQFWQTDMAAYDEYIASLKRQQAFQAKHAMEGSKDIVGQIVNAGALAGALSH
jgi:uncharacterized coiled-coil protein SlyX